MSISSPYSGMQYIVRGEGRREAVIGPLCNGRWSCDCEAELVYWWALNKKGTIYIHAVLYMYQWTFTQTAFVNSIQWYVHTDERGGSDYDQVHELGHYELMLQVFAKWSPFKSRHTANGGGGGCRVHLHSTQVCSRKGGKKLLTKYRYLESNI